MSGFSSTWLDLRESADRKARDKALATRAARWLQAAANLAGNEPIIVDLGAGTGSTLRALSAIGLPGCLWRLVDHDPDLLDEALRRHGSQASIEDYQLDMDVLAELPLTGARLITASALFDLASQNFLERLVARISPLRPGAAASTAAALYAALNYDGHTTWAPSHAFDAAVLAAFNSDQRRDKGFGPALGPDAAVVLGDLLRNSGFRVFTAHSPWQLGPGDHELVSELLRGMAAAVGDNHGLPAEQLQAWLQFRLEHAGSGTCTVSHVDLLALPEAALLSLGEEEVARVLR